MPSQSRSGLHQLPVPWFKTANEPKVLLMAVAKRLLAHHRHLAKATSKQAVVIMATAIVAYCRRKFHIFL